MIRRKMRLIAVAGLVLILTFTLVGGAVAAKPEVAGGLAGELSEEYIADEILVKFNPGVGPDAQDAIHRAQGARVKGKIHQIGVLVLRIPTGQVLEKAAAYQKNPNVEYAEPNFIAHAHWAPDDPLFPLQWHLDNDGPGGINVESAWDLFITEGETDPTGVGAGVTVAVIDTGVAYEDYEEAIPIGRSGKDRYVAYKQAPDLAFTNFVPGYDFVNNDAHPNDDGGHGTHVTGTIAQSTNNDLGVAGVAFNCSIMPVKVLDAGGRGTYDDIANGICFAADNGADIINLSLGGPESITLENAVAHAYGKGVTVIASAGNRGPDGTPSYPAAYDAYVIAVGATRYDEAVVYYSTTGSYLDLTAPGGQLYIEGTTTMLDQNNDGYWDGVFQQTHDGSDYTNFNYWFYQGTSMAAPHVSGVAALLISKGVATTPDEVRQALQSTAEDKGAAGWDAEYGWGIVDAYAALMYEAGPAPLTITTSTLPDGTVEVAYSATLEASGGTTPYTWSIVSGSYLPDGLALDASGEIFGTPTTAGTSTFTIKVTDSTTPTPQEATKELSITVKVAAPALSVTVATDATSYTIGDTVSITVGVTDAAGVVSNASVHVEVITGRGAVRYTGDGTTEADGKAYFEEYTIATRDGTGTYTVTADASHPDYESGSGSTTFEVTR